MPGPAGPTLLIPPDVPVEGVVVYGEVVVVVEVDGVVPTVVGVVPLVRVVPVVGVVTGVVLVPAALNETKHARIKHIDQKP